MTTAATRPDDSHQRCFHCGEYADECVCSGGYGHSYAERATRPDALELFEKLATSANTVASEAGSIRACDVMGYRPHDAHLRNARRALTDGLRALDQFEGREG